MKLSRFVQKVLAVCVMFSAVQHVFAADDQAWQVTGKAWKANAEQNWDEVIKQADLAQKRWGAKAKADNATLADFPKGDAAKKHANLNGLATITMLKGDALAAKGDKDGAIAAYNMVISDYKYGQVWDQPPFSPMYSAQIRSSRTFLQKQIPCRKTL